MDNVRCNVCHTCYNRRCENSVHTTLNGTMEGGGEGCCATASRDSKKIPELRSLDRVVRYLWRWYEIGCEKVPELVHTQQPRLRNSKRHLSQSSVNQCPNDNKTQSTLLDNITLLCSWQPAVTSYFAHNFTSCQSISPTDCLLICYVNCVVIVYWLTQFHYNI